MMLYSFQGSRPEPLPFRITLPNGFTRTDPDTFTEDEIALAGFSGPYEQPDYNQVTQELVWSNGTYNIIDKPPESQPVSPDLNTVADGILAAAASGDSESLAEILKLLISLKSI
jgi:hypothetical protein